MLPSHLLEAISHSGGGRVVLVTGAGCSFEAPTSLPLSKDCSQEAHRRLRADGVLPEDCDDPLDLSRVADAVYEIYTSQEELVSRMPKDKFRTAVPNEGHKLAAAMLLEHAVSSILTLNFDLAFSTALSELGLREDVATIVGPEDQRALGTNALIYLHRNAYAQGDQWILRSNVIAREWQGRWEEVVAQRVLAGPVTVFAGLGSAAGVLIETVKLIKEAVGDGASVYQVDPGQPDLSAFFASLSLPPTSYIQVGWGDFMRALANRLIEEHKVDIAATCQSLIEQEGWESENIDMLSGRMTGAGLIHLGNLKARWTLDEHAYAPKRTITTQWVADLLLAIGRVERVTALRAELCDDGVVEFWDGTKLVSCVIIAHGRGFRGLSALEAKVNSMTHVRRSRALATRTVMVSGIVGVPRPEISAPESIVAGDSDGDIVASSRAVEYITTHEIRNDESSLRRLVA